MSRRIHQADVAMTSAGAVLLNVAHFENVGSPRRLLEVAVAQRGELFVGVVLSDEENTELARAVGEILWNATGPIVQRRLRRGR